jgi:segregation and condensation protein B
MPNLPISAPISTPLSTIVESLLFVADGPTTIAQLAAALDVTPREIEAALAELEAHYEGRGLSLQRIKDRVQLTTAPEMAAHIERFLGLESAQHLSRPALETLAIVAYQQPVTRPQLEAIRGVNCDGVIKSLLSKGLIEESGRTEGPGRPILYVITPDFLQHFGLASLDQLPPLELDKAMAAMQAMAAEAPAVDGEADPATQAEAASPAAEAGQAILIRDPLTGSPRSE